MEDRHWIDFVASNSTEKFLEKSEKAKQSAVKNKDLARVGRWGYSGLRAYWRTNKDALLEQFPQLGALQSERATLHVLGRLRRNKNTGLKELTSDVQERLNKLARDVLKERQMKAAGSFFVAGKDPLIEGMRARMMEDMETIVRMKVMEELAVQENNTTLQGPSIVHSTGVSAVSVDTFDEIEVKLHRPSPLIEKSIDKECELIFVHFGTEYRVAKGVIYPSNGILHGEPMDQGFLKIQVDTADDGWDEVIVPKPTDEVKTLKDVKGGQFIQWPKNTSRFSGECLPGADGDIRIADPDATDTTRDASVATDVAGYVKDATMGSVSHKAKMAQDAVECITFLYLMYLWNSWRPIQCAFQIWSRKLNLNPTELGISYVIGLNVSLWAEHWPSSMPSDTFQQAHAAAKSGVKLTCFKLFYGISMLSSPASSEIRDHIVHACCWGAINTSQKHTFRNMISSEMTVSSKTSSKSNDFPHTNCIEQNVCPRIVSFLQLNVNSLNGSHRRLTSSIKVENQPEVSCKFPSLCCMAIIVERLPSGVLADPFELEHLTQRGGKFHLYPDAIL
ncbi:hypothetical protein Tco_0462205, partial [Tanacetum coccineum]